MSTVLCDGLAPFGAGTSECAVMIKFGFCDLMCILYMLRVKFHNHFHSLVQDCNNSKASALELQQSCTSHRFLLCVHNCYHVNPEWMLWDWFLPGARFKTVFQDLGLSIVRRIQVSDVFAFMLRLPIEKMSSFCWNGPQIHDMPQEHLNINLLRHEYFSCDLIAAYVFFGFFSSRLKFNLYVR